MSSEASPERVQASVERAERVHISCPGCGRHDWVRWPLGQEIYHWKCFNCGKEFDLTRDGRR